SKIILARAQVIPPKNSVTILFTQLLWELAAKSRKCLKLSAAICLKMNKSYCGQEASKKFLICTAGQKKMWNNSRTGQVSRLSLRALILERSSNKVSPQKPTLKVLKKLLLL